MQNVLKFPYKEDETKLIQFEFIAGPLRLQIRAEDKLKAMMKANLRLGSDVPAGVWMDHGPNCYRWVEGNFFD